MTKIIFLDKLQPSTSDTLYVTDSTFSGTPLDDFDANTLELIESISKLVINGKSIREWLQYDNLSFWWIIHIPLIQKALKLTKFIENFSNYLETKKPEEIIIKGNFSNLSLIKQCAIKYNIKLTISSLKKLNFDINHMAKNILKEKASKQLTKNKINRRKQIFLQSKKEIPESNNKIMFIVQPRYRRLIFNPNSNSTEYRDWLAQDIMDLFNIHDILGVDLFTHIRDNDVVLKQRIDSMYNWFPIEIIFNDDSISNNAKKFLQNYDNIITNSLFHEQFQIYGVSFWNQVKEIFDKMKNQYYFPYYITLVDSLNQYFTNHKPKALFLTYEYAQLALCIISTAKKFGIKTIGIAHSIVYENHYGYSHRDFATIEQPFDFPLPDHTLLFGNYSKQIMKKQGYPDEKLTIFGKSDYFNLEKIKQSLKDRKIHEKYNIPKNSKIILFTSQKFQENYDEYGAKYDFDSRIWETLLKNYANSKSYFLILKPHPREKNVSIYENLIQQYNANNAKILQDDLFELLYISDLVLSFFSNALLDALCFEKPAIRVKFGSYQHPIFDNSEALLSTSLDDLPKTINQVFNNSKIRENLILNSKSLIKEQLNIPIPNPRIILDDILINKNNDN